MSAYFIAGEWGSVIMRLYLCMPDQGAVVTIAEAEGPGVIGCTDFEASFFAVAQPWFDTYGNIPVILAGMIGGNIGWRDTGYAACPAGASGIKPVTFSARNIDISIAPGLSCRNIFGLPDVVRGEEMQIMGWLSERARPATEQNILCLPGRHVKWAVTQGEQISSFFTGMNGEMEDVLLKHSLLGRGVEKSGLLSGLDFENGMALIYSDPTLSLGHALFATRSRLVLGELRPETAAAFLSGLLIGADIRDALTAYRARNLLQAPVLVFGSNDTASAYVSGIETFGATATVVKTPHLAVNGLFACLTGAPA